MSAIPLSIVVGGPLAGVLLSMDGMLHLRGWQWLYLVEGAPAILLGFAVLMLLPDRPADVRWLTTGERQWLEAAILAEHQRARADHGLGTWQALLHPTVWGLALVMFTCQSGSYGLTLWLPQILKGLSGLSDLLVGMISALPYIAAAAGMVLIGASSDRTGERFLHIAIPSLVAVAGFVASAWITSPVPALIALTVAAVGDLGSRGPFWALPSRFLAGPAAAGGIALINTIGSLGGFVGPYAVGIVKHYTGSFTGGLMLLALLLVLGAAGIMRLRHSHALQKHEGE
jgi:nitrate/nitrite transporter NarK